MNTVGDPISADEAFEYGLANRVVEDHELFDAALAWGRKLAGPGAARGRGDQARLPPRRPRRGPRGRARRVPARARLRGRARGRRGVHREARAEVHGQVTRPSARERLARHAAALRVRAGGRADGRRHLGAVGHPRLPHADDRAVGERRPDGGRPHRRLAARPGALLGLLRPALRDPRRQAAQRRPPRDRRARAARARLGRGHAEHRRAARAGGLGPDRGPRVDPDRLVPDVRRVLLAGRDPRARPAPAVRLRRGAQARRRPVRRAAARAGDAARDGAGDERRADARGRLLARGLAGRRACPRTRCARAASWRS